MKLKKKNNNKVSMKVGEKRAVIYDMCTGILKTDQILKLFKVNYQITRLQIQNITWNEDYQDVVDR